MNKSEELTVLQRVAAGDANAFQECVDRYKGLIWWLARKWTAGAGNDAEDVVQEIFVDLWKSAEKFDPTRASESTFVSMISRRRLIDRHRRSARRPVEEEIDPLFGLPGLQAESVEAGAEISFARRAMRQLSDEERETLELSVHVGMSHSEIADHLQMPLGSVKTYIRRALAKVRDQMDGSPVVQDGAS
jgi:RNA polymerase sigma-70 factor (ECF subfamily)